MRNVESYVVTSTSTYVVCRYLGYIDGIFERMDEKYFECEDECFQDGEIAGEIAAISYCVLSILFGGLDEADDFDRGDVATCGLNFQTGCEVAFDDVTVDYVDDDGSTCVEYTAAPYNPGVYSQWRFNNCTYNPEDPSEYEEASNFVDEEL
jgi:hypothetical protein